MSDNNSYNKGQKPDAPEWLIENIAEASKNARTIFFVFIGFLAYCLITLTTTSDKRIILNELVHLPILNQTVSINGFFIISPSLAIIVFIYFQLYLSRIRGLIIDLRTNYAFPGNRRLYPWLVNIAEEPEHGLVGKMQVLMSGISLWWLLPLVLMFFSFTYVKKHEPVLSYFVGMIPLIGTIIVIGFWCLYDSFGSNSRNGKENLTQSLPLKRRLPVCSTSLTRNTGRMCLFCMVLFYEAILLFVILPGLATKDFKKSEFTFLHDWIYVDLSYQDFSKSSTDLRLKDVHLEGANLKAVTLNNVNLMGAYLKSADLSESELNEVNLTGAYLQSVILNRVKLQKATISDANLQGAFLNGAQLQEAKLNGADLTKAKLSGANLSEAELQPAFLVEAELDGACLYKAKLESANLYGSRLGGACLKEAELKFADLGDAEMGKANLQQADLTNALVTVEQLSTVATLYGAKLDQSLEEKIKKAHPRLLEEPHDGENEVCTRVCEKRTNQ